MQDAEKVTKDAYFHGQYIVKQLAGMFCPKHGKCYEGRLFSWTVYIVNRHVDMFCPKHGKGYEGRLFSRTIYCKPAC